MIISNKHKFVFVHNPKVAGTSIRSALDHLHDDVATFWHQAWLESESRVVDRAHLTADLWAPITNPAYTSFGFVRDPYARLVSGLKEFRRRHGEEFDLTTSGSVKYFIMTHMTPANLRWDWRFIHLCPQHYFFYIGNKCVVDKIGKYDELGRSWASICSLLGLQLQLPHERVSAAIDTEYEIALQDPIILARVNSLYLRDSLLFGYDVRGDIETGTHSQRVSAIHDPTVFSYLTREQMDSIDFPAGERKALNQKRGHL